MRLNQELVYFEGILLLLVVIVLAVIVGVPLISPLHAQSTYLRHTSSSGCLRVTELLIQTLYNNHLASGPWQSKLVENGLGCWYISS